MDAIPISFRRRLLAHLERQLADVDAAAVEERADEFAAALLRAGHAGRDLLIPELRAAIPETARAERRDQRRFQTRLHSTWGEAFDGFLCLIRACEEIAEEVVGDELDDRPSDPVASVLSQLTGTGIRSAWEVHHLVTGGLPDGAAARARTVHEIAVTCSFILESGPDPELVNRFLDHRTVRQAYWAEEVAALEEAERLVAGSGLTPAELASVCAARDELVARHGPGFRGLYGWAHGRIDGTPGIKAMERAVGLDHMRPTYTQNSLTVHPSAWGLDLATIDGVSTSRGRDVHLSDPINATCTSLVQLMTPILTTFPETASPVDSMFAAVLLAVSDEVQDAALKAERTALARYGINLEN